MYRSQYHKYCYSLSSPLFLCYNNLFFAKTEILLISDYDMISKG